MAITHGGIRLDVAAALLPEGYVTSPTTFSDHEGQYENIVFEIDKSTVEEAAAADTMDNIIAALDTAVEAYLEADLDSANNLIDTYGVLKNIRLDDQVAEKRFTDEQLNYVCVVDLFYKTVAV